MRLLEQERKSANQNILSKLSEEVNRTKLNIIKEETEANWYGIPGIKFIWHGEWSDPEIEYKGLLFNVYDIGLEEAYSSELEEELGRIPTDEEITKEMKMREDDIKAFLETCPPSDIAGWVRDDIAFCSTWDNGASLLRTLEDLKTKTIIPTKAIEHIIEVVKPICEREDGEQDAIDTAVQLLDEINWSQYLEESCKEEEKEEKLEESVEAIDIASLKKVVEDTFEGTDFMINNVTFNPETISFEMNVLAFGSNDNEARHCSECGKGMSSGYVVDSGAEYYCSDECLHKHYTEDEWTEMYDDGNSDNYWTEWEDEAEMEREISIRPRSLTEEGVREACDTWMSDHNSPDAFYESAEVSKFNFEEELPKLAKFYGVSEEAIKVWTQLNIDFLKNNDYDYASLDDSELEGIEEMVSKGLTSPLNDQEMKIRDAIASFIKEHYGDSEVEDPSYDLTGMARYLNKALSTELKEAFNHSASINYGTTEDEDGNEVDDISYIDVQVDNYEEYADKVSKEELDRVIMDDNLSVFNNDATGEEYMLDIPGETFDLVFKNHDSEDGEKYHFDLVLKESEEIKNPREVIKKVCEEKGVNLNNKVPFELFYAPDDEEWYSPEYDYADFYNEILEELELPRQEIVVTEVSDGKCEMEINGTTLDLRAWDNFEDILENLRVIIGILLKS